MMGSTSHDRVACAFGPLHLVACALLVALAKWLGWAECWGLAAQHAVHGLLGFLVAFHLRLVRGAEREAEELAAAGPRAHELFEGDEGVLNERGRALVQFERFLLPAATVVVAVIEAAAAIWLWRSVGQLSATAGPQLLPLSICLFIASFAFFLIGRYAAGLSATSFGEMVRAPAGYALLSAAFTFLAALAASGAYLLRGAELGFLENTALVAGRVISAGMCVLALEKVGIVVACLYSPSRRGTSAMVYRSRLAELLVAPEQFVHGVTDVLDYQFGFRVSETWFFGVLVRAVAPLLALQLAALALVSCLVIVNPGEVAIVETWGAPKGGDLRAGLHLKLPWPVQTVQRLNATRIREVRIGLPAAVSGPPRAESAVPGLWQSAGEWAAVFVSASRSAAPSRWETLPADGRVAAPSVSLLIADVQVHYRVRSARAYLYNHTQPERLLEGIVRRCSVGYFATHDGAGLLQADREKIASALAGAIQSRTDSLVPPLGIEVLSVAIIRLQPPVAVVNAYQDVIAELQRRAARLSEAEAYYHRIVPDAEGAAAELRGEAMAFRSSNVARAEATGGLFKQRLALHAANPRLYRYFTYLDRLEKALVDARKIVVAGGGPEQVVSLDLKQGFGPELLDVGLPGTDTSGKKD